MKRYRIVDKDRFSRFVRMIMYILIIVLIALFIRFMEAHNGLGPETLEYHIYEIVQQTSPYNHRVKIPILREVVYKTFYH